MKRNVIVTSLALMLGANMAFGAIGFDEAAKIAKDKTGAEVRGVMIDKDRAGEFYRVKSKKDNKCIEVQIDANDGKIIEVREFQKGDRKFGDKKGRGDKREKNIQK